MTALLAAPPPLKSPRPTAAPLQPYRFTVKQFHQMWELGYFTNRQVWLYRGTLIDNGPMNPPHAVAGEKIEALMWNLFRGWRVRTQKPLVLGLETDPQPDIAIVAGQPTIVGGHPTTASLVIEISDTTFDEDVTTKAELYATAGIADYWVLDVDGRTLHVFRDPAPLTAQLQAVAYQTHLTFSDKQTVSPLAVPTATINVADLLP